MAFNVNDNVIVQKVDKSSPEFKGVIETVLGGGDYKVRFVATGPTQNHAVFFKNSIVTESEMVLA